MASSQFLIYQTEDGQTKLDVRFQDENVWLTKNNMADLFQTSSDNISLHLKNIFANGELTEISTTEDFSVVRQEGSRQVKRQLKHYSLDAIISVGYRVQSHTATSLDYNKDDKTTQDFFAKVQNKLHFAIHGQTAAELIMRRADSDKEHMGLTSWDKAPEGKIVKNDVVVAKNYLQKNELESLGRIVNAYLDLAEDRAKRKIPMTMDDWSKRLGNYSCSPG